MEINWLHKEEREGNMNCQDMEELLGAYALGALSEEERKAADAHLADCPKCTRTIQQFQAIVDSFPLSVPAYDPPPRLKAQIIARIQASENTQHISSQQTRPLVRQRSTRWQRWSTSLMAASLLLLLLMVGGMFFWNLSLSRQVSQLSMRVAPPVTYSMHGTGNTTSATGQVIYYPEQNITVLVVRGLPQPGGTHVYQGWLLQGKAPQSIGLFNVQNGVATLDFQGNISGYDAAAISLERGPMASNSAPKGPVVALGSLKTT